jgi:FtsP/CotA-like multicopper oxidase with cupredoxin domain
MKKGLHRKERFSRALRGALGLALVLTAAQGCSKSEQDAWTSTADFKNPEELQPEADVYKLVVGSAEATIEGKRYCLRSYNGKLTAPTLRVPASSKPRTVRVDLVNAFLKANTPHAGHDGSDSHAADFNTTNLHTHGLHVSPGTTADGRFASDDVLLQLKPQESRQFRFDIDAGKSPHQPGTFWYHPHVHGSTAIQVANGMAGALIIEGEVDQLPGIREARERIFVFQQIPYDHEKSRPLGEGERCDDEKLSINDFDSANLAQRTLINGIPRPLITMPPGQVERWRFIHAGVAQFLKVTLYKGNEKGCERSGNGNPIPLQQIAEDGITFSQKEQREHVLLAPGYRADVMVQAPMEEGTYCLLDAESLKLDPAGQDPLAREPASLLAVLKVDRNAGAPTGTMPSDEDLHRVAPSVEGCSDNTTLPVQTAVFAQEKGDNPNCPEFFNINCKSYNPDEPRVLTLGRTEEWQVSSAQGRHPFHIHVNPFLVCPGNTVNEEKIEKAHWKDTLYIGNKDGVVRLRTTYEDFTGRFVMHCHLLHHEDRGMMEAITITSADAP